MMRFLELGARPSKETGEKKGSPNYRESMLRDCDRYLEKLRQVFGMEPSLTLLTVAGVPDQSPYYQVVCCYNSQDSESVEYAFRCKREAPENW